jgi:hypothetical protein
MVLALGPALSACHNGAGKSLTGPERLNLHDCARSLGTADSYERPAREVGGFDHPRAAEKCTRYSIGGAPEAFC